MLTPRMICEPWTPNYSTMTICYKLISTSIVRHCRPLTKTISKIKTMNLEEELWPNNAPACEHPAAIWVELFSCPLLVSPEHVLVKASGAGVDFEAYHAMVPWILPCGLWTRCARRQSGPREANINIVFLSHNDFWTHK